ncbi:MAG: glycosyltransferase family 4 protein [Candidatus Dormibacteraeota bacterium]|nr:glycosyltransferase family 4 protein [Candidatus Dormibacteraeota bacterium]MBV9524414.1 glycosyltransferase family 4 protein [Candidatus Dormibacteraeota bacterium]
MNVSLVELYGVGGTADYTDCLAQALADRGHDVSVITSSLFEPLRTPRYAVHRVFGYKSSQPRWLKAIELSAGLRRARAAVERARAQVVHAQGTVIPAVERRFYASLAGRARVCTAHDVTGHERRRVLGAYPPFYATFDALVCHSRSSAEQLQQALPGADITVMPHARYTPLVSSTVSRADARQRLGLSEDARVALMFGFLRPYKGLGVFLAALQRAAAADRRVVGLVAGRPLYDISAFRRAAARDHTPVRWDLRHIPRSEMHVQFAAADVVVLPYTDTSDSGLIELAAAFRRPVVVTRTGGLPEAFARYGAGAIVPPRDPAALARAIVRTAAAPPTRSLPGAPWSAVAAQTEALYERLLAMAGPDVSRGAA